MPRVVAFFCATVLFASTASALTPPLYTTRIATGLSDPIYVTSAPNNASRLFVVEQGGLIKVIENGNVLATPFLDLSGVVSQTGGEQGLLGLAFDPNYATNGYFYVNYTLASNGATRVVRYTATGATTANPSTARQVLGIDQPYDNHNGGWMDFGPDGYLYVATGDGGSGNDPGNRAQNTSVLLGKMLRIDPSGDAFPTDASRNYANPTSNPFVGVNGADEVWAYGLRNPWRNSFDRLTGDLYIGDVGQGAIEEINFQPADSLGGENYGWRVLEGTQPTGLGTPTPDMIGPIHEYSHDFGRAVTGGYVYRGGEIEGLDGTYFFADYASGRIWSFRYDGSTKSEFQERTAELQPEGLPSIRNVSSFGEDADGNLYIVSLRGDIYKLNGYVLGDATKDGRVDGADYVVWAQNFKQPGGYFDGDFDRNGVVDGADYIVWATRFQSSAPGAVAVPEPATAGLLVVGFSCVLMLRLRRKSR